MHRFRHAAMATQFEVRCTHPNADRARQAANEAFAAVDRLEHLLSRFVENSDIARISRLSPGESTIVAFETMQCLQLARLMFTETGGAFDPSLGTGFERLQLSPGEFVVGLQPLAFPEAERAGESVSLDLGAIGKGYAVDRMAEVLEEWEVTEALIDAGYSSVLALEPPAGEAGWPLTLSQPGGAGSVLVRLTARQQVLGASGLQKGQHIWDPIARAPAQARAAAWVSAPRPVLAGIGRLAGVEDSAAAVADALSTAFMIGPAEGIESCCRIHPGLEAWVLERELLHFPTAGTPGTG